MGWGLIFLLIFLGLPLSIYFSITLASVSFVVRPEDITTDSGILLRRSKAVAFKNVQSVETVSNPLASMFGISTVEIWTASQNQLELSKARMSKRPIND